MKARKLNQSQEVSELFFSLVVIFAVTTLGVLLLRLAFWVL